MKNFVKKIVLTITMVIDDNDIDKMVDEGFIKPSRLTDEVISAWKAVDALSYLKVNENHPEKLPDAFFLDLNMLELNGFTFVDQFHQLTNDLKAKVRIVISKSSTDKKLGAQNKNLVKFISKPLTIDELRKTKEILMFKNKNAYQHEWD